MSVSAPNPVASQRADIRIDSEIANAWHWLLLRAPRIAKAINDTPGSARTMADILAGMDLFHRRYGLTTKRQFAEVERQVEYQESTDLIVVRQNWRS